MQPSADAGGGMQRVSFDIGGAFALPERKKGPRKASALGGEDEQQNGANFIRRMEGADMEFVRTI